MTQIVSPARATFLFTAGTGLASGLGNWMSASLADKRGGLTQKQLVIGMGITLAGIVAAYHTMKKMDER